MPDPPEYEEEDLFEDLGGTSNPQPMAGPSRQPISAVPSPTGNTFLEPRKARLQVLYARRKRESEREAIRIGVRSLKRMCIDVVRYHQARVWDVGDLEYPVIREFLLGLPREQLEEVENNSNHLKEDTDWLWEIFLLEDHPTQYERCNTKDGEPRTRGWRRMYRRVREEIGQRQENAKRNLADRYAKMEQERDAKKIQVIDRLIPDKRKRGRGGFSSSSPSASASSNASARSIIAKARSETNRARVALTHASGRYLPPASGHRPIASPFSAPSSHSPSTSSFSLARIPPPRPRHTGPSTQAELESSRKAQAQRAALPAHLVPRPPPPSSPHFRLETPKSKYQTIVKPQTASFQPPPATITRKGHTNFADYFGDAAVAAPKGLMASLTRANGNGEGSVRSSRETPKRSAAESPSSGSRKRNRA